MEKNRRMLNIACFYNWLSTKGLECVRGQVSNADMYVVLPFGGFSEQQNLNFQWNQISQLLMTSKVSELRVNRYFDVHFSCATIFFLMLLRKATRTMWRRQVWKISSYSSAKIYEIKCIGVAPRGSLWHRCIFNLLLKTTLCYCKTMGCSCKIPIPKFFWHGICTRVCKNVLILHIPRSLTTKQLKTA